MARIRSVFPSLATDEAFMSMSAFAKAAWPLLWTECDDQGVFEWKPIVLKARLLPADNIDFESLLSEWADLNVIRSFEVDGRRYGAVKNFRKYQKPKKANAVHPLPPEFRSYVRIDKPSSEPVPNQVGTEGGKSRLMEDGGGKREELKTTPPPQASGGVVDPPSDNIPSVLDRRAYPEGFEALWAIYRPIAAKNATKVDACHAWVALSTAEQADCATGLRAYVSWLIAERRERSATPAKHLATFIDRRGWEPFLEAETATGETKWVPDTDPRWPDLAARFEREKQRPLLPMSSKHQSGMGCYFRSDWLEGQEKAA